MAIVGTKIWNDQLILVNNIKNNEYTAQQSVLANLALNKKIGSWTKHDLETLP